MSKTAFITGVTGQDGSYLSELLLEKGYTVVGMRRRSSSFGSSKNIDHLRSNPQFILEYGDLTDPLSVSRIMQRYKFDEIYNLAAQSHVGVSFINTNYTTQVNAIGVLCILDLILESGRKHEIRFYQASTSELFGDVAEVPQTEETPFRPRSPYAVAKAYGFSIVKNYRDSYGLFACNGILFNHESPRRGENFVTRKITSSLAKIVSGELETMALGNLSAKRDWGHAKDFVIAQWKILQQESPDDYVIATGVQRSVEEFVVESFRVLSIELDWSGTGLDRVAIAKSVPVEFPNIKVGQILVKVDPRFFRPSEVEALIGDSAKAERELAWHKKCSFEELVGEMVRADLEKHGVKIDG